MEVYILKSAVCLVILFSFYKLFLENESMHEFKRFYLLGALIVSFVIPLITFTTYVVAPEVNNQIFLTETTGITANDSINFFPLILWALYGFGVAFFSVKFFKNLRKLFLKIKLNPKVRTNRIIKVLLKEAATPHTFFSYIFLNKEKFEKQQIPKEVLLHEETHALQKHSLDILIVELIQILFWFNPIIYFIKRSVKLNHEFLADRAVLDKGIGAAPYQNLLLSYSSKMTDYDLANSINYSSIKKRITVMKTHTSRKAILLRTFFILPILAILIYGFSSSQIIEIENNTNTSSSEVSQKKANAKEIEAYNKMAAFWNKRFAETNKRIIPLSELQKLETIYREMTPEQKAKAEPFPECEKPQQATQEKATKAQVAEYNTLAKKYNDMPSDNMFVQKKDVERLTHLYGIMSAKQKSAAQPFPKFPPMPEPPTKPKTPKSPKDSDKNTWVNDTEENIIPPPPPIFRLEPIDHIVRMADENAAFFYEEQNISSEKAIALIKNNKKLYIETTTFEKSNPIVKISKTNIPPPPPPAPLPAQDPAKVILEMAKKGATFYVNEKEISSEEAIKMVREIEFMKIEVEDSDSENPIVRLIGC